MRNRGCIMPMLITAKQKAERAILAGQATLALGAAALSTQVFAAGDEAKVLMETAISIIAVLVFIPAGIMTITGIVSYASAHSEGDGPGQKKAINMISAGIMLAALGIILTATKDTFSGIIATSIT